MQERVEKLAARLELEGLDAILVTAPENRRYLSGFTGSSGYLFITQDHRTLLTDSRYTEQAAMQSPHFRVVQVRRGVDWLSDLLRESGARRVGFESEHVTVASYNRWVESLKGEAGLSSASLTPTQGIAEELRVSKDREELAQLQKAIDASDAAMEAVCPAIAEGMTEQEIAWRMEAAMREFGADANSFGTIVAAGPNGAMAHHRPTDRPIQRGEPIVIDMGARVAGYCSDITRTVTVGEPDNTFRKVYDIVLGAQLTAIHTVRPGMTGEEGDGLARTVINQAGYEENFGHSLGHGVGLAVHEKPHVGPGSRDSLQEGMVFTVEPGIYISGWGGVRIEDIVILGPEGATPLSKAGK